MLIFTVNALPRDDITMLKSLLEASRKARERPDQLTQNGSVLHTFSARDARGKRRQNIIERSFEFINPCFQRVYTCVTGIHRARHGVECGLVGGEKIAPL